MAVILETEIHNRTRDNDYFTSTIVGLPSELVLGKAFTVRKLSATPTIIIDAVSAATWLSDPARMLLKQQVKSSPNTLGLPFAAGSLGQTRSKMSSIWSFLFGFGLCATLSYAYMTQSWLQQLIPF
jgi:hypothetical protein